MFESPAVEVHRFITSLVHEVQPPTTLRERNVIQLTIVERVRRNFDDLDPIDTLVWVATRFNQRFPQS